MSTRKYSASKTFFQSCFAFLALTGCAAWKNNAPDTVERPFLTMAESLDPLYTRPLLHAAKETEGNLFQLLINYKGDMAAEEMQAAVEDSYILLYKEIRPKLNELSEILAPVFKLYAKTHRDEASLSLKKYPWVNRCLDFYESTMAIPINDGEFKGLPAACIDNDLSPASLLPLVTVTRAMMAVNPNNVKNRFLDKFPSIVDSLRESTKYAYASQRISFPNGNDADTIMQSIMEYFNLAYRGLLENAITSSEDKVRLWIDRLPAPGIENPTNNMHISAAELLPLRKSIMHLNNIAESLPLIQVCDSKDNKKINGENLKKVVVERLQKYILPALAGGMKLYPNQMTQKKVPHIGIKYDADSPTGNQALDAADYQIIFGSAEALLFCRKLNLDAPANLLALTKRLLNAIPAAGETRPSIYATLADAMNSKGLLPLVKAATTLDKANEEFLESIEFLLAHEIAHILFDTDSSLLQTERELRSDMLAAAVVDIIHPDSALTRAKAIAMTYSLDTNNNTEDSATADALTSGPAMLWTLLSETDYEKERMGDSHPPIEERMERLNAALYNIDYWRKTE